MKKLSDIIVYDIFSPPVASRIYAYPTIAAYEVLINDHLEYKSFAGQLSQLDNIPKPDQRFEYSFPLASIHAFLIVGKDLIFSEDQMEDFQTNLYLEIKSKGIPNDIYNRSLEENLGCQTGFLTGVLDVTLTSAIRLDESSLKKIKSKLSKLSTKSISINQKINSNIIGGFILKVDDKMYDASYRTKLKNIKKTLLNN